VEDGSQIDIVKAEIGDEIELKISAKIKII
jgi:hypothetical protein